MSKSATKQKKKQQKIKKKHKGPSLAELVDPQVAYQLSVQNTEHEVEMLETTFEQLRKRKALTLKEDFCGTALLCAEWVKSDPERRACGLDIDQSVLDWGIRHNMESIGEPGDRVALHQQDVMQSTGERFDIVVGFNFSYWLFQKRETMKQYLRTAWEQVADDGMLVLDFYGGWEAQEPMEEPRDIEVPDYYRKAKEPGPDATLDEQFAWQAGLSGVKTFEYVWDQHTFNPIDNSATNYIHFRYADGSRQDRAFSYTWRVWSLVEIQELLDEVGFSKTIVYWEESDEEGEGTGEYTPQQVAENDPGWLAYLVALK